MQEGSGRHAGRESQGGTQVGRGRGHAGRERKGAHRKGESGGHAGRESQGEEGGHAGRESGRGRGARRKGVRERKGGTQDGRVWVKQCSVYKQQTSG